MEFPGAGEVAADLALDVASLLFPEGKAATVALALAGSTRASRVVKATETVSGYAEAIARASKKFPVTEAGHFGRKTRSHGVREISSRTPEADAKELFDMLRDDRGAKPLEGGMEGLRATLEDETAIVYRPDSVSGGPVVEINYPEASGKGIQKVHFVRKGER